MKMSRQSKILELIKSDEIQTQKDLADKLKSLGYDVTQATVSRDIRELKLTKVSTDDGQQRYTVIKSAEQISERIIEVFRNAVLTMAHAQNILVIRTLQGMANAVGVGLDAMNYSELLGCIAGDDTLICIVSSEEKTVALMEKLNRLIDTVSD